MYVRLALWKETLTISSLSKYVLQLIIDQVVAAILKTPATGPLALMTSSTQMPLLNRLVDTAHFSKRSICIWAPPFLGVLNESSNSVCCIIQYCIFGKWGRETLRCRVFSALTSTASTRRGCQMEPCSPISWHPGPHCRNHHCLYHFTTQQSQLWQPFDHKANPFYCQHFTGYLPHPTHNKPIDLMKPTLFTTRTDQLASIGPVSGSPLIGFGQPPSKPIRSFALEGFVVL